MTDVQAYDVYYTHLNTDGIKRVERKKNFEVAKNKQ